MTIYNSAIVGLGNIGFLFDLDKKRKTTWSHAAAFSKCKQTRLVAAVEINPEKSDLFQKHYANASIYSSIEEMMSKHTIDIVSICTPTDSHYGIVKKIVHYPVKAIFCEKPLALSIQQGKKIVDLCAHKRIVLAVNHTRRWDAFYSYVQAQIASGEIGQVEAVNALYAGNIFNIGTHLVDAILMFLNKDAKKMTFTASGLITQANPHDPAVSGWFKTPDNVVCSLVWTGTGRDLIFEVDVIGTEGRIRILNNGSRVESSHFCKSTRYEAYRELCSLPSPRIKAWDRMVYSINDIVKSIEDGTHKVKCTGDDALLALKVCHAMVASAQKNGLPVEVR